ncbi:MAG: arginine-tRNA-protein transferase [Bacteroidetes bacterium]|nr:arginine-tRNA-protein transferase [Bacteroidota bacterium]
MSDDSGTNYFIAPQVTPGGLDYLLSTGWRHFGQVFFRYQTHDYNGQTCRVVPLRVRLDEFELSDSQRKTLRRNQDLSIRTGPTRRVADLDRLFDLHRQRFTTEAPESLDDFFPTEDPATSPCDNQTIAVFNDSTLIAASFLDVGLESGSSVYGMFDPDWSKRGLGILTMLAEIQISIQRGLTWYYPGYAYLEPSFYDYKKQFFGLEGYHWPSEQWVPLPRFFGEAEFDLAIGSAK